MKKIIIICCAHIIIWLYDFCHSLDPDCEDFEEGAFYE